MISRRPLCGGGPCTHIGRGPPGSRLISGHPSWRRWPLAVERKRRVLVFQWEPRQGRRNGRSEIVEHPAKDRLNNTGFGPDRLLGPGAGVWRMGPPLRIFRSSESGSRQPLAP